MQAIHGSNTSIEIKLAKALWSLGLRYRKNDRTVFGKPDFTFKRVKVAVFCDSEFWHGKDWEISKEKIKSNKHYWLNKIERNINRDKEVNSELRKQGWKVIRFWSQQIIKKTEKCAATVANAINQRTEKSM